MIRNLFTHDVIFTRCNLRVKGFSIIPGNWGDDLNKYFFEFAANKKIAVIRPNMRLPFRIKYYYYSLIGTTLSWSNLDDCIVYGTGLGVGAEKVSGTPDKIISVRGPLTRKNLISQGYECPEHYGDPALLLPLFYKPKPAKKFNVSIIPHLFTYYEYYPIIDKFIKEYGCNLINITQYKKWTDIIDKIAGSNFIITESLHGLIAAETYNIPCIWVEFIEHKEFNDWGFKFRDFYESIGKYNMESIKLYEGFNFDSLLKLRDTWKQGYIDYETLLKYFPFEIKAKFVPSPK